MADTVQSVSNFLVPATGSPNAFVVSDTFDSNPYNINFDNMALSGVAFRPSGVLIDNTQGTGDLIVLIPQISFKITAPAGAFVQMSYPAPQNHSASITGEGTATVIFVDYPLQPYSSASGGGGSVPNPLPISTYVDPSVAVDPTQQEYPYIEYFEGVQDAVEIGNFYSMRITVIENPDSDITINNPIDGDMSIGPFVGTLDFKARAGGYIYSVKLSQGANAKTLVSGMYQNYTIA